MPWFARGAQGSYIIIIQLSSPNSMHSILPPIPVSNLIWCIISVDFRLIWVIRNQYMLVQSTPRRKVSPSKYQKATTLHAGESLLSVTQYVYPSLLWWPGHALTIAEAWLTPRHTNVCVGMCLMLWGGFLWRASRPRGVTLFNHIQLATPLCLRGHPLTSSGLMRLPLQRKYEYELLFAQL